MADKDANDKFVSKYSRKSPRAAWWDYAANAAYFVTICAANRNHYFGKIENGEMLFSKIGEIAYSLWYEIKNHFDCVKLDSFVVMPNHVHGIVIIDKPYESNAEISEISAITAVAARYTLPLPTPAQNRFQNQGKNTLSSIVGSYKSAVTKYVHIIGGDFAWQSRFHDHIIRNNDEYQRIAHYIDNNILNWQTDRFRREEHNA